MWEVSCNCASSESKLSEREVCRIVLIAVRQESSVFTSLIKAGSENRGGSERRVFLHFQRVFSVFIETQTQGR